MCREGGDAPCGLADRHLSIIPAHQRRIMYSNSIAQAGGTTVQPARRKPRSRKSRSRRKAETRLKIFWGVYNDRLQPVAVFEYHEREKADAKAQQLNDAEGGTSYFVKSVKKPVE